MTIQGGKGEQLRMFMTPGEIKSQYQPLDADMVSGYGSREEYGPGDYSERELTGRSANTAANPNGYVFDMQGQTRRNTAGDSLFVRNRTTSEDAFWESKGEEIEYEGRGFDEDTGQDLFESVAERGVDYPIHLGTQFGKLGKPQILGGHHRIHAAAEVAHNSYIPVLHHEGGIASARSSSEPWGGYR